MNKSNWRTDDEGSSIIFVRDGLVFGHLVHIGWIPNLRAINADKIDALQYASIDQIINYVSTEAIRRRIVRGSLVKCLISGKTFKIGSYDFSLLATRGELWAQPLRGTSEILLMRDGSWCEVISSEVSDEYAQLTQIERSDLSDLTKLNDQVACQIEFIKQGRMYEAGSQTQRKHLLTQCIDEMKKIVSNYD